MNYTRREFIQHVALGLGAPLAGLGPWPEPPLSCEPGAPAGRLGRTTGWGVGVYEKPAGDAARANVLGGDEVIPIYSEVEGEALASHNSRWYETDDGFIYSSFVQPVENSPQLPLTSVPETGLLAEVSVPYLDAQRGPGAGTGRDYRLYYGTVYRVLTVEADAEGTLWYGMDDAGGFQLQRYAPASGMRIIQPGDLAPLAPGVEKYIRVTISTQLLEAFEGTRLVFSGRVASGTRFWVGGELQDFTTPLGRWTVIRKRPSSHMRGGTKGQTDYYDLPGVPFVTYFTLSAAAVHGTYWHNDYGRPRSHGCVNMLPEQARWVYRWADPPIAYEAERVELKKDEGGTVIDVVP
jgi:hypothetical protein